MAEITLELVANFTQSSGPCEIILDSTMPDITELLSHIFVWDGTGWASSFTMNFYADNVSEQTKFCVYERFAQGAATLNSDYIYRLSGANKIIVTVDNWGSAARGTAYITFVLQDKNAHIERQTTRNAPFTTISFRCSDSDISSITNISLTANTTFSQNIPFTIYGSDYYGNRETVGTGQFVAGSNGSTIILDEEKAKEFISPYIEFVTQSNAPAGQYTFVFDFVAYVRKYVIYVDEYQGSPALFVCGINYYDGTKFVPCYPHYYNGTEWIPCNYKTQITQII